MKKLMTLTVILFVISIFQSNAQCLIKGKVTNEKKEAIIGATILIQFVDVEASTDIDGIFSFKTFCEDSITLEVTHIGYKKIERRILTKENMVVNFILKEDGPMLEEVTVTGDKMKYRYDYATSHSNTKKSGVMLKSDYTIAHSYYNSNSKKSEIILKSEAGLLTAGEVNDFGKWKMWQDITKNELKEYQFTWKMNLKNRYTVQVMTQEGIPIIDEEVQLLNGKEIIWKSRTDNTGKAELWANVFDEKDNLNELSALVIYNGETYNVVVLETFQEGINMIGIKTKCDILNEVDVMFVVDATFSMADEINYLKSELTDIIGQMQAIDEDAIINLGSVFYRDKGDFYLTQQSDFSDKINKTLDFIENQNSGGGGDRPEAVESALEVAINQMTWSDKAKTRLLFLVLDAPPHDDEDVLKKLKELTLKASEKGIRIIPIAASGIDKSTEYLMRCLALSTNGTYTFLTDDSGIGNPHIEPTTDSYDVELLNDLLVRLFKQYTQTPSCEAKENKKIIKEEIAEIAMITTETEMEKTIPTLSVNYYPNPTTGQLTIEVSADIEELFITDLSGKIIQRHLNLQTGKNEIDLTIFPSGIYFIQYFNDGKTETEKIVLAY